MSDKSTSIQGTKYSTPISAIPVTMRLPINAASVFEGMSVDFNALIRDCMDENLFNRNILVKYNFRYVPINFNLDSRIYERLNDALPPLERGSNTVGKACGIMVALKLGLPIIPLSGRLANSEDVLANKELARGR